MAAILALAFLIPFAFTFGTEISIGRNVTTTGLVATLTIGKTNVIPIVLVIMVPISVTLFSTACIQHLVTKKNTVAPMGVMELQEQAQRKKMAKAAIKLILAVSGAFWFTYVPASVIRVTVASLGYTWHDFDTRKSLAATLLSRFSYFLYETWSSLLNPFLICYTHPEIRARVLQLRDQWRA